MSLTRPELITGAGVALLLGACGGKPSTADRSVTSSSAASASTSTAAPTATTAIGIATPASCVLAPEQTEGPYYIDGAAVRSDISEGKAGAPLRLALTVVDASSCAPVANAAVEIWHADAGGNYSGFGSTTSNRTFLRGIQLTAADGVAHFATIYPG